MEAEGSGKEPDDTSAQDRAGSRGPHSAETAPAHTTPQGSFPVGCAGWEPEGRDSVAGLVPSLVCELREGRGGVCPAPPTVGPGSIWAKTVSTSAQFQCKDM